MTAQRRPRHLAAKMSVHVVAPVNWKRVGMRRWFVWWSTGAMAPLLALLTALIANAAQAGDAAFAQDQGGGARASACGAPGETCARIRGYIKAGSDFTAPPAGHTAAPPLLAGIGAAGQAAADALNRGIFLLKVGGDDSAR
jgi:hypothetical protein